MDKYKRERIILIIVSVVVAVLFANIAMWYGGAHPVQGYIFVRIGDTRERVIDLMGNPDQESSEFRLSQYEGFEEEYAEAEKANATIWLIYRMGIDITAAIGLDSDDIVVYKAKGGS